MQGETVDLLFEALREDTLVYSTYICHLCKFGEENSLWLQRAKSLFTVRFACKYVFMCNSIYFSKSEGFEPAEEVFNHFLQRTISVDQEKLNMLRVLKKMNELGVHVGDQSATFRLLFPPFWRFCNLLYY